MPPKCETMRKVPLPAKGAEKAVMKAAAGKAPMRAMVAM